MHWLTLFPVYLLNGNFFDYYVTILIVVIWVLPICLYICPSIHPVQSPSLKKKTKKPRNTKLDANICLVVITSVPIFSLVGQVVVYIV